MSEVIVLSREENRRAVVLATAHNRTNREVSVALGLSVRQVQRLKKSFREQGAAGLAHGNRGRPGPHRLDEEVRQRIEKLYRDDYKGFNFSHFHEKLELSGLDVSLSSVSRVLRAASICSPRKRRPPKHRSRRERRSSEGAMLQLDGSRHDWLEGRGPYLCLLGAIDDATGKVPSCLFREYEDAQGYFLVMRQVVSRYGIPETIYRDRHGIFESNPKQQATVSEQLEGRESTTQFGRLMVELGVRQITAYSPEAKGRIERLWGTLQDRLVSELRRANASTLDEANLVLEKVLLEHNRRFHRLPGDPQSLYRKLDRTMDLDAMFCFKYRRTVARDNTIAFFGQTIQIGRGAGGSSYSGSEVEIQERFDGSLHIFQKGVRIQKTAPAAQPPKSLRVRHRNGRYTEECPWTAPIQPEMPKSAEATVSTAKPKASRSYKPPPNHPWRRPWVTQSQTNKG